MNDLVKNLILWGVIALILLSVFSNFSQRSNQGVDVPYSDFIGQVKNGNVSEVDIAGREITGKTRDLKPFTTYSPETDNRALIGILLKYIRKWPI